MRKTMMAGLLALTAVPALAQQPVSSVVVADQAPYSNKDIIASAIVNECDLPHRVTEQLLAGLKKNGIEARTVADPTPGSGDNVLLVEIASAESSGNAFMGHHKGVTVTGKLFQKGKQVATFVDTRVSGGGAWGGYKGSCAVLGRCTVTIGEDISRWLKSPVDGAKLGDQR